METKKLYYDNQYTRSFSTKVLRQGEEENGRPYIVLEETAFYPTGGGQPHDTGALNGVRVRDVEEVDGEIRHYTEKAVDLTNNECIGEIDWERRFDHMQQHTGQHILSAAFEEAFGYKTVSFHLGKEICTIDLETSALAEEEAKEAEKLANKIILENRPVKTKWITEEELPDYRLRKDVAVSGDIRLVIIPDFDYNGCGGTHPDSSGQASALKILHWEKEKKKIRVSFVCGQRVLDQLHGKHQAVQGLTDILNSPQEGLESAAKKLLQQNKDYEKTIVDLKTQLMGFEAGDLVKKATPFKSKRLVQAVFQERPITELQQLAKLAAAEGNDFVVILVNETGGKLQVVCAGSDNAGINMNQLMLEVLPLINGRGGGKDSFAQGGGEKMMPAEELMERLVKSAEALLS
ncbi:DHHA1 domain-containing protein [Evansella sp. LMS18]|nr:DHHA1 domain-containing protein [Evansella sp. LMS18]UTR11697.1 DHHA1 domain-containing protein [Evansella sp. LMS18]